MLSSISGIENLPQAVKFLIAFAIISMLLVLFALVLRRLTGGRLTLAADRGRARQPRLGIVDVYDLDRQRQLILLRRDNVEHLLLVGGPNDVVVETNIVRVPGARLPSAGLENGERADAGPERLPEMPSARPVIDGLSARQAEPRSERPAAAQPVAAEPSPIRAAAPLRAATASARTGDAVQRPALNAGALLRPAERPRAVPAASDMPAQRPVRGALAPANQPVGHSPPARDEEPANRGQAPESRPIGDAPRRSAELPAASLPSIGTPRLPPATPQPSRPDNSRPEQGPPNPGPRVRAEAGSRPQPAPISPDQAPAEGEPGSPPVGSGPPAARGRAGASPNSAPDANVPPPPDEPSQAAAPPGPPAPPPPAPPPPAAANEPAPPPEPQQPAPPKPDPFSIEDIEAEFARLLGRPLDRKDNKS